MYVYTSVQPCQSAVFLWLLIEDVDLKCCLQRKIWLILLDQTHVNTFNCILARNTNGCALRVKKGYRCTALCLTSQNPTDLHSYFTSRLSSQICNKAAVKDACTSQACSCTTLWFVVKHYTWFRLSVFLFGWKLGFSRILETLYDTFWWRSRVRI